MVHPIVSVNVERDVRCVAATKKDKLSSIYLNSKSKSISKLFGIEWKQY